LEADTPDIAGEMVKFYKMGKYIRWALFKQGNYEQLNGGSMTNRKTEFNEGLLKKILQ